MHINNIDVLTTDGWNKTNLDGNEWNYSDVSVKISQDGEVFVFGETTEIYSIRIGFDNVIQKNSLVLSDTWERAYGDLEWCNVKYNKLMPWYFMECRKNKIYGYGVKTLPNSFCSWQCDINRTILNIDIRCGNNPITLSGRTINACTIVMAEYEGYFFEAVQNFCKLMCDHPRCPERPVFGGNDWYCNYGDNSFDKILLHTRRIVECSKNCKYKPYMVIDDGWELCHHKSEDDARYYNGGPWKYCNDNFGDMKKMAETIEKEGAIPGIWFRPLWTVEKFPEKYILKTDGMKDTLDPSVPEVLDIIREDVKRLKDWGYKLIKHDFSTWDIFGKWGFEMQEEMYNDKCTFFDKSKTTAEIIKNMYFAIREAAGNELLVMGCNTVSHLSAGIFDIQRTGDDTSGLDWERTKKYGVNTLAFRMPQHNSFYAVDADCVGITKCIDWNKNRQWLDVLAKSGTPLFVSVSEDAYNDKVKSDISIAFEQACIAKKVSKPVDWFESKIPSQWQSDFGVDKYEW